MSNPVWKSKDLGPVDAYAEAVAAGYTGTRAEWLLEVGSVKENAQAAAESAAAAGESETAAAGSATAAAGSATDANAAKVAAQAAQAEVEQYTAEAIDDWLDDHIDPETGYALDTTLSLSNAAAPADKVGALKSAFNNSLSTSVKSTFHTENPGSAFLFLIGNINTDTGAMVSSNVYAALTGYQAVENSFFGMTTDDYYYRVVYTRSNQTSTGNVIYATDYVKGTNLTGLNYPGAAYYKVVAVKDLTGTVSMENKLDDVLSKTRFYRTIPYQLDTSLTQSGKAADAKATGDIIYPLADTVGAHTVDLITNTSAFVNTDQSYIIDGTQKTYLGWDTSNYIECTPGQTLAFRLVGFNKTISGSLIVLATIAFFDSGYGFVDSWYYTETTSGTQVEGECVVPSGAAYFKALYNDEYMATTPYVKVVASGICEEIEDLQHRIPNRIPVKIAFVGDSLTQGLTGGTSGAYTFASKPYPTICKEMLDNRGFDVTVKNFGRRGLSAKSYWNTAIPSNGTSHSPASGEPGDIISFDNTIDAVIIMLGTNGSLVANTIAEDTAISGSQTYLDYADTQCGDYCKIIEYIMEETENHAQIILVAPIYSTAQDHESKMINTLPTIQALGQRYQIPVINALYESGLGKFNASVFYNTTDFVHLNQAGYHKFGTFMASQFINLYSTFNQTELT